jgi:hypothetical protein
LLCDVVLLWSVHLLLFFLQGYLQAFLPVRLQYSMPLFIPQEDFFRIVNFILEEVAGASL